MRQLGKRPAIIPAGTLRLQRYVHRNLLPFPPVTLDLTSGVAAWPMYGNDILPDCTSAAAAHMSTVFSLLAGAEYIPEEPEVEALWLGANGGDRTRGAYEANLLAYWQQHPLKGNVAPAGYVQVDWHDHLLVKTAARLFAGLYIGLALPISAQFQPTWRVVTGQDAQWGSWGGHAVNVVGYDQNYVSVVTWGAVKKMSWGFWDTYVDEVWAILPSDWNGALGIDYAALQADLLRVGVG